MKNKNEKETLLTTRQKLKEQVKIILNLNKLDINGKPWQEFLRQILDSEKYRFWEWTYNQFRGVNFSCDRCGLRVTNGIGYGDYETTEAYLTNLDQDGYGHLYCEADSWAKGYSHAYLTPEEYRQGAYDYHIHQLTRPFHKEVCLSSRFPCGTCETWNKWLEFGKVNQQKSLVSIKDSFNHWYWNQEDNYEEK